MPLDLRFGHEQFCLQFRRISGISGGNSGVEYLFSKRFRLVRKGRLSGHFCLINLFFLFHSSQFQDGYFPLRFQQCRSEDTHEYIILSNTILIALPKIGMTGHGSHMGVQFDTEATLADLEFAIGPQNVGAQFRFLARHHGSSAGLRCDGFDRVPETHGWKMVMID